MKLNSSQLKIIAIIGMFFNHVAHVFGESLPDVPYVIFTAVGGVTFPVMAYLLNEGYKYTRDIKKYAKRLLVFALISFFPFVLALYPALNIIFSLLLGLGVIHAYETFYKTNQGFFWLIFAVAIVISFFCDWGGMCVPIIFCYHVIKGPKKRVIVPVVIVWFFSILNATGIYATGASDALREMLANLGFGFIGSTASIPLLLAYNGKKGNAPKYLFYVFYPAHLLVLYLVHLIF
ncbi:hypothetical protein M2150_001260 [Lachnospiraceae bacterium PM6-15]|uniref:TraX family protein n=1 Tax=Ohessyouella blattaphilus TaxID=2949333 RepID=UPI003E32E5FA